MRIKKAGKPAWAATVAADGARNGRQSRHRCRTDRARPGPPDGRRGGGIREGDVARGAQRHGARDRRVADRQRAHRAAFDFGQHRRHRQDGRAHACQDRRLQNGDRIDLDDVVCVQAGGARRTFDARPHAVLQAGQDQGGVQRFAQGDAVASRTQGRVGAADIAQFFFDQRGGGEAAQLAVVKQHCQVDAAGAQLLGQVAGQFLGQLQRDFRITLADGSQQRQRQRTRDAVRQAERDAARRPLGRLHHGRLGIRHLF
jgi:hypothetical protein